MDLVVFNKQKFDMFFNMVGEMFKDEPAMLNMIAAYLEMSRVPIQVQQMPTTNPALQNPVMPEGQYADLDSNRE